MDMSKAAPESLSVATSDTNDKYMGKHLSFFPSPSFIFPKKYILVTHRSRVKGEIVMEIGDCLRVSVTVTRP